MRYLFQKKQRLIQRPVSILPAPPPAVLPASTAGEGNAFNLWLGGICARGRMRASYQQRNRVVARISRAHAQRFGDMAAAGAAVDADQRRVAVPRGRFRPWCLVGNRAGSDRRCLNLVAGRSVRCARDGICEIVRTAHATYRRAKYSVSYFSNRSLPPIVHADIDDSAINRFSFIICRFKPNGVRE